MTEKQYVYAESTDLSDLDERIAKAVKKAFTPPPTLADEVEAAKARLSAYTEQLSDIGSPHGLSVGDILAGLQQEESTFEPGPDGEF